MSDTTPIPERPHIVKYGTVSISIQGIEIRDFKTENTPSEGDLPKVVIDWAMDRLVEGRKLFGSSPKGVLKYTDAIRRSLSTKNWFGALFLSLAMPDICGALEAPTDKVGTRYKKWFERYLRIHYRPDLFSADDCYYLRCAAIHQGLSEHPQAQNKRVYFISPPPPGMVFHSNYIETGDGSFVLQLQIDVLCEQICAGVEQWLRDVSLKPDVMQRTQTLLEFYDPSEPIQA